MGFGEGFSKLSVHLVKVESTHGATKLVSRFAFRR